ncbi:MAG: CHC2 zinc finger domain-containing protein [Chloroflexota bacterium]
MIDVDTLKRKLDCRILVERDLGKPKYRTHEYSTFKCPFHHERKGYSLVVYADYWHCFGKCGARGDVIGWVQRYDGLSFQQACETLAAGDLPYTAEPLLHPEPESESRSEPPDEKWQKVARQIADQAADRLWCSEGRRALAYLQKKRGLSDGIIAAAQLGYIPGQPNEWRKVARLRIPCGIAIPWYADGAIWGIKVRRAAGDPRYLIGERRKPQGLFVSS